MVARTIAVAILLCAIPIALQAQENHDREANSPEDEKDVLACGSDVAIFASGRAEINRTYFEGKLAKVSVFFDFAASEAEYQDLLALIDRERPLGSLNSLGGFRVSDESEESITIFDYAEARVDRASLNCTDDPDKDCGIRSIAVTYWFPAQGIVSAKTLAVPKRFGVAWYDLTINSRTFRVIDRVADTIVVGQFVRYATTAGGAVRLAP